MQAQLTQLLGQARGPTGRRGRQGGSGTSDGPRGLGGHCHTSSAS